MDARLILIKQWLSSEQGFELKKIETASADASFRRYFRAHDNNGSYIVMDAPPELESISEFIEIAQALDGLGVHTPKIYASDVARGLILLEDLGSRTYLDELRQSADQLYRPAITALIALQNGHLQSTHYSPPTYTTDKLHSEMDLFEDWFIKKHLSSTLNDSEARLWAATKQSLVDACMEQPQVWVHRDYHSRNLMITEKNSPGVIDFQDMVLGPVGYDLASLFKDCYIEWPREQQLKWLEQFHQRSNAQYSFEQLTRWYDMCALQRHFKVLGIFCRLNYRDGKDQYLADLPLVAKYVLEGIKLYPQFAEFDAQFSDIIRRAL